MDFKPFKIGKYLLLERLAMGGMAEVYRAKASGAGGFEKQLAIKRILPHYSSNEEFRRMFEYEARLSSMLTNSNIVQVYDFVKSGDTYLLAMEFVDGKNLRQFINKAKKAAYNIPLEHSVYIINEVCKGLEYAHKKKDDLSGKVLNIIHRDMSPQNVMLSYEGSVKIVDFGIAKAKDRVDETRSGVIKGKFGYMSPEQANGEQVDHRTDIFSTTIILYELLTAKRLFAAENDMATLKLIQECVIPPPSRINPKIPSELEKIVMRGLAKDIKQRFNSAGDLHRQLQEFLNKYYPSYSSRELSESIQRVFKEEIITEKKRFEQIYYQSIPFSQGRSQESEQSDEGSGVEESATEDPRTQSGVVEKTADTFFGEESSLELQSQNEYTSKWNIDLEHAEKNGTEGQPAPDKTQVDSPLEPEGTGTANKAMKPLHERTGESTLASVKQNSFKEETESTLSREAPLDRELNERSQTHPRFKAAKPATPVREQAEPPAAPPETPAPNPLSLTFRPITKRRSTGSGPHEPQKPTTGSGAEIALQTNTGAREISSSKEPRFLRSHKNEPSPLDGDSGSFVGSYNEAALSRGERVKRSIRKIALFTIGIVVGGVILVPVYRGLLKEEAAPPRNVGGKASSAPAKSSTGSLSEKNPTEAPSATPDVCTVELGSDPSSNVFFGTEEKGRTPLTVNLRCNQEIDVTFRKEGYETSAARLHVKDSGSRVYRSLRKIPTGTLQVFVSHNAEILLGDRVIGNADANRWSQLSLEANKRYTLTFRNSTLNLSATRQILIQEGTVVREAIKLE